MLSRIPPDDFNKRFDLVGCYILHNGSFVLLNRHERTGNGNLWCLPGGTVEEGETPAQATVREVQEETGIELLDSDVKLFATYYVRQERYDFEWHIYSTELLERPRVQIDTFEHTDFKWVTPKEAVLLPLVEDQARSIKLFFK